MWTNSAVRRKRRRQSLRLLGVEPMRLVSIDMEQTVDPRFIHVATLADGSRRYAVLGQIAPISKEDEHVGKLRFEEMRQSTRSGTYIATLHAIEDKQEWEAIVKFAATERIMRMRTEAGITVYTSLMTWWENWCYQRKIPICHLPVRAARRQGAQAGTS